MQEVKKFETTETKKVTKIRTGRTTEKITK
jgi:hypothetical protein